jgi:hypothetical protein
MEPTPTAMTLISSNTLSDTPINSHRRRGNDTIQQYDDITNRIHVDDLAAAIFAAMTQQHVSITNDNTTRPTATTIATEDTTTTTTIKVYNLADDLPESRTVVMQYATQLLLSLRSNTTNYTDNYNYNNNSSSELNHIAIRQSSIATTQSGNSTARDQRRRTDQKRINNTKMKQELLPQLKFPTYKEGLQHILNDRNNPWWTPTSS